MLQSVAEVEIDKLTAVCASLRLHATSDHDISAHLLEPVAAVLGAESAAYRCLRLQDAGPRIEKLTSIGVAATVADDYLSHFQHLDPTLESLQVPAGGRLALQRITSKSSQIDAGASRQPLPAPPPAQRFSYSGDAFQRYYRDFLYPNGLVHHTGFMICDVQRQRVWIFNFHRPASAPQFTSLEHSRTRLIEACLQGQVASAAQIDVVASQLGLIKLTTRERDVVAAVARGYANKQIAAALNISPRTVENHLRNIYDKLHINTRTQLLSILHKHDYKRSGAVFE